MNEVIQNPGSALGEAIGSELEKALNAFLTDLVDGRGYYFFNKSLLTRKDGAQKKLLMYDKFGTGYNVDSVIVNDGMQPIILIESKYIRYKKHNRDKGSWVCTAHPALRRRYASIRSSIAVLAGSWSSSSLTMMKSHDINIFLIPFSRICDLLANCGIDFDWDEKDRGTAMESYRRYCSLTEAQREGIGWEMINLVKEEIESLVLSILDDETERDISRVVIELHSNLGEVKEFEFATVEDAVEFLNAAELDRVFITSDSLTLFDPPPPAED